MFVVCFFHISYFLALIHLKESLNMSFVGLDFQAVLHVCQAEKSNEQHMLYPSSGRQWINPSKRLVDRAIERWNQQNLRADNTSVVTVMLDPPGPPRAQVLKRQRELAQLNQGRSGNFFVTIIIQIVNIISVSTLDISKTFSS